MAGTGSTTPTAIGRTSTTSFKSVKLQLGPVMFADDEHPDELPIPRESMLAEHVLIGGGKDVQDMGSVVGDITWSGKFWYDENADQRVRLLLGVQEQGLELRMRYNRDAFDVRIKTFRATYRADYIEYTLTVVVVRDVQGSASLVSPSSVDELMLQQMQANATNFAAIQAADPTGGAALASSVQLPLIADNVAAAGATKTTIAQAATAAIAKIQPYLTVVEKTNLPAFLAATQALSTTQLLLANANIALAPKTIRVDQGNFVSLAAKYYGDASLAVPLMRANGFRSLNIASGITRTISLPPTSVLQGS